MVKIANFQSYFCPWQFRNGKTYINLHNIRPKNPILTYSTVFWNGPYITRTETCIIHKVLKFLCSDNANFMAILSHYIGGHVVIKVALFSRLYGIISSLIFLLLCNCVTLENSWQIIFHFVWSSLIYLLLCNYVTM